MSRCVCVFSEALSGDLSTHLAAPLPGPGTIASTPLGPQDFLAAEKEGGATAAAEGEASSDGEGAERFLDAPLTQKPMADSVSGQREGTPLKDEGDLFDE